MRSCCRSRRGSLRNTAMPDYRSLGRAARKRLPAKVHKAFSSAICETLKEIVSENNTVLLYSPIDGEVDVASLKEFLRKNKKTVLLPAIRDNSIVPVQWSGSVLKGKYGIEEPAGEAFYGKIEAAIIPMCAFDASLNRVGFGKGYYDRFLQGKEILKIGVAFSCQQAEKLTAKATDVKMDRIITENGILKCKGV